MRALRSNPGSLRKRAARRLRAAARAALLSLALGAGVLVAAPPALADAAITSPGPLTEIGTTSDLNCSVRRAGDDLPEFYQGTACGTFLSLAGTLYSPAIIPAGDRAVGTPWTGFSQTPATGSGTVVDPFRIVTVVDAGTTGVRVTQTDSYVTGQESYRTDITLSNMGNAALTGILYRAGDCYLANSDSGAGRYTPETRAVACTNEFRVEEFIPLSPDSNYYEAQFGAVWQRIGDQQPFPDLCEACDQFVDNGAGLSWNVELAAGATITRSMALSFEAPPPANSAVSAVTSETGTFNVRGDGTVVVAVPRGSPSDVTISIAPECEDGSAPTAARLVFAGAEYPMTSAGGTFSATLPAAAISAATDSALQTVLDCATPVTQDIGDVQLYDPSGIVSDATTGQPIQGANVTLHRVPDWQPATAATAGQPMTCETLETRGAGWDQFLPAGTVTERGNADSGLFEPALNPFTTTGIGYYGWDVALGCWYVTVEADGYRSLTSPVVGVPPEVTDLDLALQPVDSPSLARPEAKPGSNRLDGSGVFGEGPQAGAGSGTELADVRAIAVDVSRFTFPDADSAATVVLARDDVFADALAGAPLAGDSSPILYTPGGADATLDPAVRAEIDRVLQAGGRIHLLGGPTAVSAAVATELTQGGYQVQRLSGPSRIETAVAVAREVVAERGGNGRAVLAYANNWPDAITAGAWGAATGTPVLLTDTDTMHPATAAALIDLRVTTTYIAGGSTVIADATAAQAPGPVKVAGTNRMGTAAQVATQMWDDTLTADPKSFVVANLEHANAWTLALAAAPMSAALDAPQLGVRTTDYPTETAAYFDSVTFTAIPPLVVIGNLGFVSTDIATRIDQSARP